MDFAQARRMMVDGQIRPSDVTDPRILAAMLELPREAFVPAANAGLAYLDLDVPVGGAGGAERCLLKPMVLAKLVQAAEIGAGDRVLDVACATGYSSAVLGKLAKAVVAVEEDAELAAAAKQALRQTGAQNVSVVPNPLIAGYPSEGPYDVIFINGAVEVVPPTLFAQLKDGGRLLCLLGRGPGAKAMLYRSAAGDVSGRSIFNATAPVLPGFAKAPEFVF